MTRDDQVYILDMVESIETIAEYLDGKTEMDFEQSNFSRTRYTGALK